MTGGDRRETSGLEWVKASLLWAGTQAHGHAETGTQTRDHVDKPLLTKFVQGGCMYLLC